MQKIIFIVLIFLNTANCKGTGNMETSIWKIKQATSNSQFFKEGMMVDFSENYIRFKDNKQVNKYTVIVSENRMVIETGHTKWLFEIELNDSILVLHELYVKNPIVISLVKIKNQKINKS